MMRDKPSPPPVADLYPRNTRISPEPMLITAVTNTSPQSNHFALTWPTSSSPSTNEQLRQHGKSPNQFLPIAEQKKMQTSLAISPTGQPVLKVQSSYLGYFTPRSYHSSTPINSAVIGGKGDGLPYGNLSRRRHGEERCSSFISFSDTPTHDIKRSITWPAGSDTRAVLPFSRSLCSDPILMQREVHFRGTREDRPKKDEMVLSPASDNDPSFNNMSISTINSSKDHSLSDWSYSERQRLQMLYQKRHVAPLGQPTHSGFCQILCWLLMTTLVVILFFLSIFFIYSDYQRSTLKVAPPNEHLTLKQYLDQHLIGQAIAINEISLFFDTFSSSRNYNSAVVSFHGGTGVGKTFATRLLTMYYFSDQVMSDCFSTFFVPIYQSWKLNVTRDKLNEWLTVEDINCPFQLHIMEDLGSDTPSSLVSLIHETLKKVLDENPNEKRVFLIITDVASIGINQIALDYLESNNQENLSIDLFHSSIKQSWGAIDNFLHQNSEEGSPGHFASLSDLINISIPFMPLERHHVKECAKSIAKQKGLHLSDVQLQWVADQLVYGPPNWPVFSTSGCKLVSEKVDLIHNVGEL